MRAIAGLRTDGGTAFCRDAGDHEWPLAFKHLVEMLRRDRGIDEEAHVRREGLRIALPIPWKRGEQVELDFHEVEAVRDFADARPIAEVIVDGVRRERLTFHVPDRAFVRLAEHVDPDTGEVMWRVRVEAKARELYADGLERWMSRWLGLWTWLLSGTWPSVDDLGELGWRTTQWHLNADFVGIDFDDNDARRFVGVRKFSKYGRSQTMAEQAFRGACEQRIVEGATSCAWVQTVMLGRKGSDSQMCIYRKGDQLREAKRVDPRASMYAPLWMANGWVPDDDGDPLRVELRLRKKGLQYEHRARGPESKPSRVVLWDFRDPKMLLCGAAVRELWWHHTWKRRLVEPTTSRQRRAEIDPRWDCVRELGLPRVNVRQVPRRVRELTRDERIARDVYEAAQAAVKFAARSGVLTPTFECVGDALVAMGRRLQSGEAAALLCPLGPLPDLEAATERAAATSQFFREQAMQHYEAMSVELDQARGRMVERDAIWEDERNNDSDEDRGHEDEDVGDG